MPNSPDTPTAKPAPGAIRSHLYDDLDRQIAEIRAQIAAVQAERDAATGEARASRGWWLHYAGKRLDKYLTVQAARAAREHRFIVHEPSDRASYAVCACGVRFRGTLHEDFAVEEFPLLAGHLGWEEVGN